MSTLWKQMITADGATPIYLVPGALLDGGSWIIRFEFYLFLEGDTFFIFFE